MGMFGFISKTNLSKKNILRLSLSLMVAPSLGRDKLKSSFVKKNVGNECAFHSYRERRG